MDILYIYLINQQMINYSQSGFVNTYQWIQLIFKATGGPDKNNQ